MGVVSMVTHPEANPTLIALLTTKSTPVVYNDVCLTVYTQLCNALPTDGAVI